MVLDPVEDAGKFLQAYGWPFVFISLVGLLYVAPMYEDMKHRRSLAAAQDPARRQTLDERRQLITARRQKELDEAPRPAPAPAPKRQESAMPKRPPAVSYGGLNGFGGGGGGYQPTRRRPPGGGGG